MIAIDTTFLVDYLEGTDATAAYLEQRGNMPFFAPSLSLFEVYRGAARTGGAERLDRVVKALNWIDPLPVDEPAAREAARIEAELLARGDPINVGDTLIAGVCRENGARLLTRDHHFDRIDDLEIESY